MVAEALAAWRAALADAIAVSTGALDPTDSVRLAWRGVFAPDAGSGTAPPVPPLLWAGVLAALRPAAVEHPLDAELVDALLEGTGGTDEGTSARREQGAYYTPVTLAAALCDTTLADARATVLDPACGGGALLLAAYQRKRVLGATAAEALADLRGIDVDAAAVEVARLRVHALAGALATALAAPLDDPAWRCADTLALAPEGEAVDVVVANPPFGNAIRGTTARDDAQKEHYLRAYPQAATGAYDRASLFVEWAVRAARTRAGLIVPRALLAAPYAERLRGWVEQTMPLVEVVEVERHDAFRQAAVFVAGLVLARDRDAAAALPVPTAAVRAGDWAVRTSPWMPLAELAERGASGAEQPHTLGAHFDVAASCAVGEAYDWREHVAEADRVDTGGFRLVTSGAIDPFEVHWGARTQRYLKATFERPVVPAEQLSARRRAQASGAKVLVPGLSAVLEAALDDGAFVGAVATLTIRHRDAEQPADGALPCVALYLNSVVARGWFLAHYGAAGLSGGSVQVTRNKLRALPIPPWLPAPPQPDATGARRLLEAAAVLAPLPPVHRPPLDWVDAAGPMLATLDVAPRSAFHALALEASTPPAARIAAATLALLLDQR